ncbi:MAG: hypothetical protein JWQ90_2991 [Hydrocarboniphaga sp.]|uniref:hypothetical protein n=1 Tax=Hydrocarboniphaga sp. TaxID=2033016 RepID=UPI0026391380|nr:hypothetical protein [Hydrocarboniphaga sp.]MDB5970541.1 hypothetical protein [Hydrocarboniphaga sp.]
MTESISWNVTTRAIGGPQIASGGSLQADAYDKLEVTVAAGATQAVNIAPGNWTSVQLLVINPSAASNTLTYNFGTSDIVLDGTLFLAGLGAVSLLGAGAATLTFKNTSTADITIDILVGRSA